VTPKERAHNDAGTMCNLANERFGLIEGMTKLIKYLNVNDNTRDLIIELSRNRSLVRLDNLLKNIHTIDSKKPRYVLIKKESHDIRNKF